MNGKRNTCFINYLAAAAVFFMAGLSKAEAQENKFCIVTAKEYPGRDPVMWNGLYAASDGKVYTALINEGASAHFFVYDPVKGTNILLFDMAEYFDERGKGIRPTGKIHNKPVEDDEGNIYFVSMSNGSGPNTFDYTSWKGGHWLKYDPKTGKLEDMGLVDQGIGCYPLAIDKKRGYLFGIGFTGYFYRFDLKNRVTKNLGRVSNWDICRDIFCDDEGNVYLSFPTARVAKYDVKKEKVYETTLSTPYDPSIFPTQLNNPMIDRTYDWRAVVWDEADKVAYGVTCGSGSILFRFDPHDGPEGKITPLSKMCDSKFLTGDRKDIPYSTLAFAEDKREKKIYFAPSARGFTAQKYAETFGSDERHHLIMYDIKSDKRTDLGAMQTADGRKVFGCEAASVGPDGTVYLCGQVEVKDKSKSTQMIGAIPTALHLIMYKPRQ
ncbi:MAG TPA: hypothetical protein VK563_12045 [Puia sp.]|nr:hypothetical protein [Puia sp.]